MGLLERIFGTGAGDGLGVEKDIRKSFESAIKRGGGKQQFLVKKLVKQENGRKKLMFLPDDEDPIRLTKPITQTEVSNLFSSDFGGGLYHIVATVPEEFEVWEYKIAGKEKSPFYEEPSKEQPKKKRVSGASDKISTIEALKELGLSDNVIKAITVATLAKELKIPADEIFNGIEKTQEKEEGMEEIIEKTTKKVLMKNDEFREALVKKKMEEMLGTDNDPSSQLIRMADTIRYLQGEPGILGGLGGSLAAILPAILSNPGTISQLSSVLTGEQPKVQERASEDFVKVKVNGKIVKMSKEAYLALKNQKHSAEQNENQVEGKLDDSISIKAPTSVINENPIVSTLLQQIGEVEPETVAEEILVAAKSNPEVNMVLEVIRGANFELEKVEDLLKMYLDENPAYKAIYDSVMTPANREWFGKILEELKKKTPLPSEEESTGETVEENADEDDDLEVSLEI